MKVLVTGAAGFIGSYMCRQLIWHGHDVIGIDNFNFYYPRNCKEFNVDLVNLSADRKTQYFSTNIVKPIYNKMEGFSRIAKKQGTFGFYEADIVNYDFLEYIFTKEKFDKIIHFAAMAGVPFSTKNPRIYTSVNVDGTTNLINLSKEAVVKEILFASSSSVYGNREDRKVREDDSVLGAASIYGATKVAGEVLCHAAYQIFGIESNVIRIFGPIYGPLQRPYGMFMQRAINFTHNNKPVQIYGRKGLASAKDSTYVDDLVNGFMLAFDKPFGFEIFNIGTSDPRSIQDWINAIEKSMGKKVPIQIVDVDKADVASSADISKAEKLLGYKPKVTLEEGLSRQVEIFNMMPEWYKTMSDV